MGQIKIQDTGYVKSDNSGTQASSGNRANAGAAISLKTAEFIPALKRDYDDSPDLASNSPSEVNLGSLNNMKFKLRCLVNMNVSADQETIKFLLDSVATDGYKLMWYDYTVAGEDNNGQLIYQVALNDLFGHALTNGEKTAFTISSNFYHLHVCFVDIQMIHSGKNQNVTYELTGVVKKVEASII